MTLTWGEQGENKIQAEAAEARIGVLSVNFAPTTLAYFLIKDKRKEDELNQKIVSSFSTFLLVNYDGIENNVFKIREMMFFNWGE
jgi:hypothetical protein